MSNDKLLQEFQTELEEAWRQLEVLFTITEMVSEKPELKSIEDTLSLLALKLNAERGVIFLKEFEKRPKPNKMVAKAVYGLNPKGWVDKYIVSFDEGIIGEIAKDEIPKIENDVSLLEEDPFFSQLDFKTQSFLGVPIRLGEQLIGILCLFNKSLGFTESDERLASAVALMLAPIISYERISKFSYKISQYLNYFGYNYLRIGALSLEEAMNLLGIDKGFIMLIDKEANNRLKIEKTIGNIEGEEVIKENLIQIGEGIIGKVAKEGEPQIVNNQILLNNDPFFKRTRLQISSLISVPIKCEGEVVGVINLCNKERGKEFNKSDQTLVSLLSTQVAIAIKNFQLMKESCFRIFDELISERKGLKDIQQLIDLAESIHIRADHLLSEMPRDDPNKLHCKRIVQMATTLDILLEGVKKLL
ncbi:MAG: GAF domain-containing protein [bacterium]